MASSLKSLKDVAERKLDDYTSPTKGYAFNTYDIAGEPDAPLTPADVLMANLLSLKLSAREVIPLFNEGDGPAQELRKALDHALVELRNAKPFESYEDITALEEAVTSLAKANFHSISVPEWTAVTVSKVLHRRRPQIVPLYDSRVQDFYGVRKPQNFRAALWEDIQDNLDWLSEMASTKKTPDGRELSVLRLADILIWTP